MTSSDDFLTDDELSTSASAGSMGDYSSSDDDGEETFVTKEGLKKLKDELEEFKTIRRKEVAQRLKEAISYGDLSENSEYEDAKNEQAFIEGRILELEQKIKHAKIITEKSDKKMGKEANIGSVVTVREVGEEEEITYSIVGATEADPFENKISNESPVGKAIIGCVKGDKVTASTPSGPIELEILKVA